VNGPFTLTHRCNFTCDQASNMTLCGGQALRERLVPRYARDLRSIRFARLDLELMTLHTAWRRVLAPRG